LTYPASPDRRLKAYLSMPPDMGLWSGVLVIMDAFGLTGDIRQVTDRLAAVGYLAFAPDLYSGGPRCRT